MELSNELCLDFIQHYQQHPVLWNPKNNYYFSKRKKKRKKKKRGKLSQKI
jgi:hypothetical protein